MHIYANHSDGSNAKQISADCLKVIFKQQCQNPTGKKISKRAKKTKVIVVTSLKMWISNICNMYSSLHAWMLLIGWQETSKNIQTV